MLNQTEEKVPEYTRIPTKYDKITGVILPIIPILISLCPLTMSTVKLVDYLDGHSKIKSLEELRNSEVYPDKTWLEFTGNLNSEYIYFVSDSSYSSDYSGYFTKLQNLDDIVVYNEVIQTNSTVLNLDPVKASEGEEVSQYERTITFFGQIIDGTTFQKDGEYYEYSDVREDLESEFGLDDDYRIIMLKDPESKRFADVFEFVGGYICGGIFFTMGILTIFSLAGISIFVKRNKAKKLD